MGRKGSRTKTKAVPDKWEHAKLIIFNFFSIRIILKPYHKNHPMLYFQQKISSSPRNGIKCLSVVFEWLLTQLSKHHVLRLKVINISSNNYWKEINPLIRPSPLSSLSWSTKYSWLLFIAFIMKIIMFSIKINTRR